MCVEIGGRKYWLWRAVDETGAVLDILLQPHRDTQAAKTFFERLLVNDDVPDIIHTDKLWSYGAALSTRQFSGGLENSRLTRENRARLPLS